MLRKNQSPSYTRPMSSMRRVLSAVEIGHSRRDEIVNETGLRVGQVISALYNLSFIGAVVRSQDSQGRSIYLTPGRMGPAASCFRGVRSVFDVV